MNEGGNFPVTQIDGNGTLINLSGHRIDNRLSNKAISTLIVCDMPFLLKGGHRHPTFPKEALKYR